MEIWIHSFGIVCWIRWVKYKYIFAFFYSTLIKKQVYHKVMALFSLEQVCGVLIMLILQLPIFEMAGRSRTRFITLALSDQVQQKTD